MFYKLIVRNARRNRRENGLFFGSLLISIVAFYIILSFSHQDIMIFLAGIEGDAVRKLLGMIPVFYGLTLFILFFLIYFASRFQLDRRRHEFGVYLIMGMRRSKLFGMLLLEDLGSSLAALVVGIPAALLVSELTSLVTARLAGIGIIGHRFTFSPEAVWGTAAGFVLIKFAAFLILSGKIARCEIGSLLTDKVKEMKKQYPAVVYILALTVGIICLASAYCMAISGSAWRNSAKMALAVMLGLIGTILLFFGLRVVMGFLVKRGGNSPLYVFNFRQLQENVINESTMLAVSSLLILAALCCFGAGVSIAQISGKSEPHVLDYTFYEYTDNTENIRSTLESSGLDKYFGELFELKLGLIRTTNDHENAFRMESVLDTLSGIPESENTEILLNNLQYDTFPYLICQSSYNRLLSAAKQPLLELGEGEMAVYKDKDFVDYGMEQILNKILETKPEVYLDGKTYRLSGKLQKTDIVTDRSINLSFALIVPDEMFDYYTQGKYEAYLNGVLDEQFVKDTSLMLAISQMNSRLEDTGLVYESYLQNMGRQLFYVAAASYITIYLAIIFLVIANTVIGVQFLMGQQKERRRYLTLIHLGAAYEAICRSAKKQINWYFGIPVVVAAVSSIFGVRSLFSGLLSSKNQSNMAEMMKVSIAVILLLFVIECIYMAVVKRQSSRYLLTLMEPKREE